MDRPLVLRKALLTDLEPLLCLINDYASQGTMLPRTEFELSESIRDFSIAELDGRLVGCGALHFYGPHTGEVRSLAVEPRLKGHGVGRKIVEALENEAVIHGLSSVFAFTYVPDFFSRLGYSEVERDGLPSKVWKDCLRCPKFQCCDEIAMRKVLGSSPPEEGTTLTCGVAENGFVQLPTLRKQVY